MVLTAEFDHIKSIISLENKTEDMKEELKTFMESVKRQIDSFFLYSNKGNQIKELFSTDETKTVSTIDFSYGFQQYMEYFSGMQKYIEGSKSLDISEDAFSEKVKSIMEKDIEFIKSLFVRGENTHNKEIKIPANQAINCTGTLLVLKKCIDNNFSKVEFTGNILDNLLVQSISSVLYYVLNGVIQEVDEIATQLNFTGESSTPVSGYQVF